MTDKDQNRPSCFGELDTVFPPGDDGLRLSPDTCMECAHRTGCLKAAMERDSGLKVQEEMVNRAYESGMLGFWQRWSRTKYLRQQQKKKCKPAFKRRKRHALH